MLLARRARAFLCALFGPRYMRLYTWLIHQLKESLKNEI